MSISSQQQDQLPSSALIPTGGWQDEQILQIQDPVVSSLFADFGNTIRLTHALMQERDQQYQEIAREMNSRIVELQKERKELASQVHTLEGQVRASQRTQEVLRANLLQGEDERIAILMQVNYQAQQQKQLIANYEITQRDQYQLRRTMEIQQAELLRQTEKASLEERLNELYEERDELSSQYREVQRQLETKSDQIGLPIAGVAGAALGFLTGGIGLLVGIGIGVAAKGTVQNTNLCNCISDLRASEELIQRQVHLKNEEIQRVSNLLNNFV